MQPPAAVPSVTVRRPRSAAGQRRAMVVAVAEAVARLMASGERFTTLGVGRIADEAGIARSSFYRYFPDKSALLVEIAQLATEEQLSFTAAWMEHEFTSLPALEASLQGLVASTRRHAPLIGALGEVAGYDEEIAALWRRRIEEGSDDLRRRIARGQREGLVDARLDPATTARFLVWGVERLVVQHVTTRPAREDQALARGLATTAWCTLGLGAAPGGA